MAPMQSADGQLRRKYRLGLTWPEYQSRIESGTYQFHAFGKGFAITEILDFVEERVCIVHLVGGEDVKEWQTEAERKLIEFAKKHHCAAIEALCRPGMQRLVKRMGWKETRVEMRREIQ